MDVKRFVESKDGKEAIDHLEQIFIGKPQISLRKFCDILLEINIEDDVYQAFVFSEIGSLFLKRKTGSYNYLLHRFCERNCTEDEEKEMLSRLVLPDLVNECKRAEDKKSVGIFYISKSQMWIETCAYTLERNDGEYLILMLSDITEMRNMEIKIKGYIKDVTHAMDVANDARSEFMERMSRSFREPVESIISLLEMAKGNIHHPIILEDYIKKMENTSRYMMSLIGDIRDISCLETGKTVLERNSFDLMKLMREVSEKIKKQVNDKLLGFTIEERGRLCRDYQLIGDSKKLCQVLENILSNAVKYTPTGGQIMLSYGEVREYNGMVDMEFSIQDNGVGISKDDIKNIFEPFWRKDRKREPGYDAKGLSLAISKRLVQLMNGKIEVESAEGEGSSFTVCVTLEKGLPIEKEESSRTIEKNEKCIMVADASLLDLEMVATYLEMNGYSVEKVGRGSDVVEKFKLAEGGYYQTLILDESLPMKNGSIIAKEIRSIERENPEKYENNPVPIIIMTKKAIPLEQELFKNRIIDGVLQKPLAADRLLGTLATLRQGNSV